MSTVKDAWRLFELLHEKREDDAVASDEIRALLEGRSDLERQALALVYEKAVGAWYAGKPDAQENTARQGNLAAAIEGLR